MRNRDLSILLNLFLLFFLSGCATMTIDQDDDQIKPAQDLGVLIEDKDTQIANLTKALQKQEQENQRLSKALIERDKRINNLTARLQSRKTEQVSTKSKDYYFFIIIIQTALKNAGFSPGLIDGRLGQKTHTAIKEFQRANGLPVNGRVDKKTWELLLNHL